MKTQLVQEIERILNNNEPLYRPTSVVDRSVKDAFEAYLAAQESNKENE